MSYAFGSRLGEQLYRLLPEVYRTRDKTAGKVGGGSGTEDLARYLDAHGHLLDLIHATLEQQLKDALPESSQDWLLPYFARLLAANIVSPDSEGRHAEIDNAVSWRQRKGTLKCTEEIAEAIESKHVEVKLKKGDLVEIVSDPFRGEKAKVIRVDEVKREVTVEMIEAAIPIPTTLPVETVRIIRSAN